MARTKRETRAEFGDFQTPQHLARSVCDWLASRFLAPASIVEPTCGTGAFLFAALNSFPAADALVGIELNNLYVEELTQALVVAPGAGKVRIINESFFNVDWPALRSGLAEPILIVGNPPWVTNAALGVLGSANLPEKSNFQGHAGLDAMTGKSNFDISESMIRKLVEHFVTSETTIALLCKTTVARKILNYVWSANLAVHSAEMRGIDAAAEFGASVEACLFVIGTGRSDTKVCRIYSQLDDCEPSATIGFDGGDIIADVGLFERWKHLGGASAYQWRSGVKHDCSKVMELRLTDTGLVNGLDELVDLEDTYLYPLLKSSDLANRRPFRDDRYMLVPQRAVGEDTAAIERVAPKTWGYLQKHALALEARGSSIYRKRPPFSVFGVGPYTFVPWKVAISGLYKRLHFACVGPFDERPRVLDDTAYFLPCKNEDEARVLTSMLNSEPAIEFFSARVFWDSKRPITVDLLSKLSLSELALALGATNDLEAVSTPSMLVSYSSLARQDKLWMPSNQVAEFTCNRRKADLQTEGSTNDFSQARPLS